MESWKCSLRLISSLGMIFAPLFVLSANVQDEKPDNLPQSEYLTADLNDKPDFSDNAKRNLYDKFNKMQMRLDQISAYLQMNTKINSEYIADASSKGNPPAQGTKTNSKKKSWPMDSVTGVITPSASPTVVGNADLYATADFIYWTARQEGLEYATNGLGLQIFQATNTPVKGHVGMPDWEWSPGFKVGLGTTIKHNDWDFYANYTWIHSHAHDSMNGDPNINTSTVIPLTGVTAFYWAINNGAFGGNFTNAKVDWDLHFNVLDLEMGRHFFISQYLTLRPHFGLKTSWQDQDYKATYFNTVGDFFWNNNEDYWGVGIRGGLDTNWYLCRSLSIFGDLALSSMWSNFELHRVDTTTRTNVPPIDVKTNFHALKPVLEMSLGMAWEIFSNNGDYHFALSAGWEHQIWFNHNSSFILSQKGSHGDLTLQGLTVEARLDF